MTKRTFCHCLGLFVFVLALACSGCAMNQPYAPASQPGGPGCAAPTGYS